MRYTDQLSALQGHSSPDMSTSGQPGRIWAADVVAVNPDGTVDCQPVQSRATKIGVPVPGWYSPSVGDRVFVTDLGGDPRTPVVIAPLKAAAAIGGSPTGPAGGDLSGTLPNPSVATWGGQSKAAVVAGNPPQAHQGTHEPGGSDAMVVDAAAGTGSLRTLGTGAQQATAGNDGRLSNARTPTAHATSHQPGGSDAMAVDAAAATGSLRTLGTGAQQATAGNDSRLSDARTPTGGAGGDLAGTYPNPTLAVAPWAVASFTTNVVTNNTTLSPSWTAAGSGGGCTVATGGITVPKAGLYLCFFNARCDHATGYRQLLLQAGGGNIATAIHTDAQPGTVEVTTLAFLAANAVVSTSLFSSASATWFGTSAWPNFLGASFLSH